MRISDGSSDVCSSDRSSEAIVKVRPPAQNRNRSRGFRFILLCWLIAMLPCSDLFAQATKWKEWFRQKKTQKEYLVMQIAALQAYIQVAKRGYEIAKTGLTTIGNIKDGDFNLHREDRKSTRLNSSH